MNFEDEGNKKGKNKGKTNGNNNGNNNAGKKKEKMMMGDRDEKKNKRKGVGVEGMIGNAVEEESGQNKKQKSEPIRCRCHQNHHCYLCQHRLFYPLLIPFHPVHELVVVVDR